MSQIAITLRLPADLLQRLREEHAKTYPVHRQSFNAWLLSRIG